jgi:hypothetical protein
MNARRLLLAAATLAVPFVTVSAQVQQGGSPPTAAAISAKARGARLDQGKARSASINGKKFNITPADLSTITSLDQLRAGVFLGVLDNEAGASEDVSLPPGRVNLYLSQSGGTWEAYAEQNGRLFKSKRAVERPDTPARMDPTFNRGSGCWWLWLIFTGINVCW